MILLKPGISNGKKKCFSVFPQRSINHYLPTEDTSFVQHESNSFLGRYTILILSLQHTWVFFVRKKTHICLLSALKSTGEFIDSIWGTVFYIIVISQEGSCSRRATGIVFSDTKYYLQFFKNIPQNSAVPLGFYLLLFSPRPSIFQ